MLYENFLIGVEKSAGFESIPDFVFALINWSISLAALITVVMVIAAGFRFIMSMGDEKKIQAASKTMLYAIIGMILVFIAPAIIRFVINSILGI